jgi:hypothetical protein
VSADSCGADRRWAADERHSSRIAGGWDLAETETGNAAGNAA